jgi:hypothetical protein
MYLADYGLCYTAIQIAGRMDENTSKLTPLSSSPNPFKKKRFINYRPTHLDGLLWFRCHCYARSSGAESGFFGFLGLRAGGRGLRDAQSRQLSVGIQV